jgi:hypothetical protein
MKDVITLYKSVSPIQLAELINSGWKAFSVDDEQKIFAPKLNRSYAEMLARQMDMACYSAGYVVVFKVKRDFIQRYELQTIGYQEHEEYRIPVTDLDKLNHAIVGRISLVSGFSEVRHPVMPQLQLDAVIGFH